jgi:hypothetical protein
VQGFSLIVMVFLLIKHLIIGLLFKSVQIYLKEYFLSFKKNCSLYTSPVVLSDLCKDSSWRKVDFSASSKCLRIRAQVFLQLIAQPQWSTHGVMSTTLTHPVAKLYTYLTSSLLLTLALFRSLLSPSG